jgi:putative spermidine/putrescine transport system substrate-binding protein
MRSNRILAGAAALGMALAVSLAACGTDDDSGGDGDGQAAEEQGGFTPPDIPMAEELGELEDSLSVLVWPGYAEDGSTDPKVDWVTPFEEQTGCQTDVKIFNTSDESVTLMKTGQYDVVSASGDGSLRMIAAGDLAPVNTDLVPNYADIWPFLKDRLWNTVNDVHYGVPHGYGANLLMYNTEKVTPAPSSWDVVFDRGSDYSGKVTAYDSPIYIADAALYLMKTQPDLGIENPYALDADQLAAAVDLLKQQRENVGEYWSDYLKQMQAFATGDTVVGTTWQFIANLAQAEKTPVEVTLPEEGATGWSDTWAIAADTEVPNCTYAWLDYIVSPEVNIQIAEWFGEAPGNSKACDFATDPTFCETYHAGDEEFADQIWYWTTPIEQCLDGRTDVKCTSYQEWTQAWTEVKG